MPFTDRQINALTRKKRLYEVPEPGRTGLAIRVSPHGMKSWSFRYRIRAEQKRMIFGAYPQVSLADARVKLADAQKDLQAGRDPGVLIASERAATRTAATVEHMVTE